MNDLILVALIEIAHLHWYGSPALAGGASVVGKIALLATPHLRWVQV